jgi:putative spermidine/putrescine transport system permease protein
MKRLGAYLALWLQGLLYALPFGILLLLAGMPYWPFPQLWPGWSFQAWHLLWGGSDNVLPAFLHSLVLALSVGALATLGGFLSSRALQQSMLAGWARRWAYFPFLLTPVIYALLLQYFFTWLGWGGSLGGVLLAQLFITYPFAFLFFQGFWTPRVQALINTAVTLGAQQRQVFWRVLWPYARPALVTCFFQTFLISWFEYGLTSVIGLGKVPTLALTVFQYLSEANPALAAAAGLLLIAPPLFLLWLNKRVLLTAAVYEV